MPEPQKIAVIAQSHLLEKGHKPFVQGEMTDTLFQNVVPETASLPLHQPGSRYNTHIGALPNTAPEAAES
jgi:hypothetical protein